MIFGGDIPNLTPFFGQGVVVDPRPSLQHDLTNQLGPMAGSLFTVGFGKGTRNQQPEDMYSRTV